MYEENESGKKGKIQSLLFFLFCFFFCVEALQPSQQNRVMSGMVSLPYHTFTGQA